jgi:hypothetical protein
MHTAQSLGSVMDIMPFPDVHRNLFPVTAATDKWMASDQFLSTSDLMISRLSYR